MNDELDLKRLFRTLEPIRETLENKTGMSILYTHYDLALT